MLSGGARGGVKLLGCRERAGSCIPPPKGQVGCPVTQFNATQLGPREKNLFLGGEREMGFFFSWNGEKKMKKEV